VVIHHALRKLLDLVVVALLQCQLAQLHLGYVAFQRLLHKRLVDCRASVYAIRACAVELLLLLLHRRRIDSAGLSRLRRLSAASWRLRQHRTATQRCSHREIPNSSSAHGSSPLVRDSGSKFRFRMQRSKKTSDAVGTASGIALLN
jgi:hypothetical protein